MEQHNAKSLADKTVSPDVRAFAIARFSVNLNV
jgi:hypothetical protein